MVPDARTKYCSRLCRGRAKEKRQQSDPERARLRAERRYRASKAAYARNPAKQNARSRAYYARHAEEQRLQALDRYYRNRESVLERNARWREANRDRHRENMRRGSLKYQARKKGASLSHIDQSALDSKAALWRNRCWICGTSDWSHWDHVKPLSKGGPHLLANLRPACASCNKSKSNRWAGTRNLHLVRESVITKVPLARLMSRRVV